jgi:tRNA(fMet)-specific endonuclease VapC
LAKSSETSRRGHERKRPIVRGERLVVSSIVLDELWYGAVNSKRIDENTAKLGSFLSGCEETCACDETDASRAGEIRAALEQKGETIGAYDTLIAGQCLSRNFTLLSGNISEFRRVTCV